MSIYIKGLEMPKSCFYCQFQHKNTTECLLTHKYYNWGLTTPPSDCPLIPVPPHGRLINADDLFEKVYKAWGTEYDAGESNWFMDMINEAPTIIPAKEATK